MSKLIYQNKGAYNYRKMGWIASNSKNINNNNNLPRSNKELNNLWQPSFKYNISELYEGEQINLYVLGYYILINDSPKYASLFLTSKIDQNETRTYGDVIIDYIKKGIREKGAEIRNNTKAFSVEVLFYVWDTYLSNLKKELNSEKLRYQIYKKLYDMTNNDEIKEKTIIKIKSSSKKMENLLKEMNFWTNIKFFQVMIGINKKECTIELNPYITNIDNSLLNENIINNNLKSTRLTNTQLNVIHTKDNLIDYISIIDNDDKITRDRFINGRNQGKYIIPLY